MRLFTSPVFGLAQLAPSIGFAEPNYSLERCVDSGNSVSLRFLGSSERVRRLHLSINGVELGGDAKGFAKFKDVKELRLEPEFSVHYIFEQKVVFGGLTVQCRAIVRAVANKLLLAVL